MSKQFVKPTQIDVFLEWGLNTFRKKVNFLKG